MVVSLPSCPASLRVIQPYLKIAQEHDERDPVISYWCRLYSLQTAITIDKKSDEAKKFLLPLMDWLEKTKRSTTNESITSDTAAQAYIENYALKLFIWADNMDRAGNFNKNVVKTFYTSGMLMDVLIVYGEPTEEISKNRKYAKWKATYIHDCLKNGEIPVPGPQEGNDDELMKELMDIGQDDEPKSISPSQPPSEPTFPTVPPNNFSNSTGPTPSNDSPWIDNVRHAPPPTPSSELPQPFSSPNLTGSIKLDATLIAKAQKLCKFASSALNYDDIPEAISNLQKALKLLQTGKDE